MKTIGIAFLAALLLVLAWHFNILLLLERMLNWIASLGALPRGNYP